MAIARTVSAAPAWGSSSDADPTMLERMGMRRAAAALTLVVAAGLTAGAAAPQAAPLPSAPACSVFPAGNVWNQDVSALPVATDSDTLIAKIGLDTGLHPDFGSYRGYGIPYNTVAGSQRKLTVRFDYSSQSDHVGYPIPRRPRIEAGSDHHMLIVDRGTCKLYEMWNVRHTRRGWRGGSGAGWKRTSNAVTADGLTKARRARAAAPPPTPPGCQSCPAWCAPRRSPRA